MEEEEELKMILTHSFEPVNILHLSYIGPERREFLLGRWKSGSRDEDGYGFRNQPQACDGWIHEWKKSPKNSVQQGKKKDKKKTLKCREHQHFKKERSEGGVVGVTGMAHLRAKRMMQSDRNLPWSKSRKKSSHNYSWMLLKRPVGDFLCSQRWHPHLNSAPTYPLITQEIQCGFFKRNPLLILPIVNVGLSDQNELQVPISFIKFSFKLTLLSLQWGFQRTTINQVRALFNPCGCGYVQGLPTHRRWLGVQSSSVTSACYLTSSASVSSYAKWEWWYLKEYWEECMRERK